jgi:hypothetical protein
METPTRRGRRRDGVDVIATTLVDAERRLRAVQAEQRAALELTRTVDPVDDLDRNLDALVGEVQAAAAELGVAPAERSARSAASATLTILWSDLVELEPARLVLAWGAVDLPDAWAGLHQRLLVAVESARAAVDRSSGGPDR